MSVTPELLIYSSKLRRGDYPEGWGGTPELEEAVLRVVDDRLALAKAFLESAERTLSGAADEIDYRNVISRAYYAYHHAARSCILFRNNGDVEGHTETIAEFAKLVGDEPALRSQIGGQSGVMKTLLAFMHKRHLADYYPYLASFPREVRLDAETEARDAVALSRRLLTAITAFVASRKE